jgi:Flp pilus assembly protein TadG
VSQSTPAGRGEGGQATVELALVLPLVLILVLGVVQVGLVVRDQVLTVHAAREGARAAAVDGRPGAARTAALAGTGLAAGRTQVTTANRGEPGSRVRVEVRHRSATDVPLVGALIGDVELRAAAVMRVEG